MPAIVTKNLRKAFRIYQKAPGLMGSIRALFSRKFEIVDAVKDVSFSIETGELVGFLGPNGAGKTTTLKMLSGLLNPTSGEVSVLGYKPSERKRAFLSSISLVMGQKNQLWWDLPAYDGFLLNQEIYGLERKSCDRRIEGFAEWLDCTDKLRVQVRRLSLGERMKMELIAALLHEPKVLYLDEPTIGLDLVTQRKIRQFIREYNEEHKSTILLTSHNMNDISDLCERVIVISDGEILFDGLLETLVDEFTTYREIYFDLPISQKITREELARFGEVRLFAAPNYCVRVMRDEIPAVTSEILKLKPVDLSIEDVSIDDVIARLYQQSGVEA